MTALPPQSVHLVALDSFKGSLSARRATAAVARGLRRHGAVVHERPVADGGEDTLDPLLAAGFTAVPVRSTDPLGRPVDARYAVRAGVAVVEPAETSGPAPPAERGEARRRHLPDPRRTAPGTPG
ncbi:glycerate kinase [Actinosynnema sp. CA-299493]